MLGSAAVRAFSSCSGARATLSWRRVIEQQLLLLQTAQGGQTRSSCSMWSPMSVVSWALEHSLKVHSVWDLPDMEIEPGSPAFAHILHH